MGGTVYLSDWVVDPRADWYVSFEQVMLLLGVLSAVVAPVNIAFLDAGDISSPVSVAMYMIDAVRGAQWKADQLKASAVVQHDNKS